MLRLDSLRGIPKERRNQIVAALDGLLTFKDGERFAPKITGYSWFDEVLTADRVVALSHSHRTAEYKSAMLTDIGESLKISVTMLINRIRNKGSAYHWRPDYFHRDEDGKLYPGKRIRDLRNEKYVDLEKYPIRTLAESDEFKDAAFCLVSEDTLEWQIDMPFADESELLRIVKVFISKAYRSNKEHWPGADRVPLLIIGDAAQTYSNHLAIKRHFLPAKRVYLVENGSELSFIIESGAQLDELKPRGQLRRLGFMDEPCLVNIPFALEALKVA